MRLKPNFLLSYFSPRLKSRGNVSITDFEEGILSCAICRDDFASRLYSKDVPVGRLLDATDRSGDRSLLKSNNKKAALTGGFFYIIVFKILIPKNVCDTINVFGFINNISTCINNTIMAGRALIE